MVTGCPKKVGFWFYFTVPLFWFGPRSQSKSGQWQQQVESGFWGMHK